MRVLCINDNWQPSLRAAGKPSPKFGDEDVVTEEGIYLGEVYYELARFKDSLFAAECFATLPDTPAEVIEETELQTA